MRVATATLAVAVLLAGCGSANVPGETVRITGFGAMRADWDANHTPDTRSPAGTAYDPTPGLGIDEQHDARYYAVGEDDEIIDVYSERLPHGTPVAAAKAAALAELPADATIGWFAAKDVCAMMLLSSPTLATNLSIPAVLVFVTTETAAGDEGYDAENANTLRFTIGEEGMKPTDFGC